MDSAPAVDQHASVAMFWQFLASPDPKRVETGLQALAKLGKSRDARKFVRAVALELVRCEHAAVAKRVMELVG